MKNKIQGLKVAVEALERAVEENDGKCFDIQLRNIKDLCNQLKMATAKSDAPVMKNNPYKTINTISFLMKPILRHNLYEGEYLERFSEERTEQLIGAQAINKHNEFWKQHETIRGNIYGSVPYELLEETSSRKLINSGWEVVDVDIHDFGKIQPDLTSVIEFCTSNFEYYILVKEMSTDTILVLVFNI